MLVLALQYNIRIHLDNIFFIDSTYLHLLMEFARDLRSSNRSLILKGIPISIVRYMERFGMVKLCLLQDVAE
jgi:anti-anti-sigma regulatory factor